MVAATQEQMVSLNLKDIQQNQNGRIKPVDKKKVSELATSIRENGQLQPIRVRPLVNDKGEPVEGKYDVILGRTRMAAIAANGGKNVLAIVSNPTAEQALAQTIAENLDRENTNPLDDAENQKVLREVYGWTDAKIGQLYHQSAAWVGRLKGITDLSAKVKKFISDGELSASAAIDLVGLDEADALKIINDALTPVKSKTKKTAKGKPAAKKVAKTAKVKKAVRKVKQAKASKTNGKPAKESKTKADKKAETKVGLTLAEVRRFFDEVSNGSGEEKHVREFGKVMLSFISGKVDEDKARLALDAIWKAYAPK